MSAPTPVPRTSSVDIFRDAALLLSRCAGYWTDAQLRRDGWGVHYAVDIDVVTCYMRPAKMRRYGQIVGDDPALPETLARMLGDFALQQLPGIGAGPGSLLIVSPHDEELDRMLIALHHLLEQDVEQAPRQLEGALQELNKGANDEELAGFLQRHANELMRALDGHGGPLEEIDRYLRLPDGRLLNSQRAQLQVDGKAYKLPRVPRDADDPGYAEYAELYATWRDALRRTRGGDKPEHNILRDARVLATLQWTNDRIAVHHQRLVLLTGSNNIFDAESQRLQGDPPRLVRDRFGEHCLRHLHACLGDRGFFATAQPGPRTPEDREFEVFEWLNLIFPKLMDRRDDAEDPKPNLDAIGELLQSPDEHWEAVARDLPLIAAKARHHDPAAFLADMVKRWNEQVRSVAGERGMALAAEGRDQAARRVAKVLREQARRSWTAAEFQAFLAEKAGRSLHRLLIATRYLGVTALRDGDHRVPGIPALRFDKPHLAAQQVADSMQELMFRDSAGVDLGDIYDGLRAVDPDDYLSLVLHAFVYAIRGHWFGARTLCLTALGVVAGLDKDQLRHGQRDGREAHYLLAVAQRRLAFTPADLDAAAESLKSAGRMAQEDRKTEDPRFISEGIAIRCQRHLVGAGDNAAAGALDLLRQELPDALAAVAAVADDPLPTVRSWVTRQCYTQMGTLALLAETHERGCTLGLGAQLHELANALRSRDLSPEPDRGYTDVESDFIYWVSAAVLDTHPARRREALQHVEATELGHFGRERRRLAALADLARSRNPRS